MKILYFAWVRQKIGIDSEEVTVPRYISNVADLIEWLKTRDDNFSEALSDIKSLRIAVNQEFADFSHPVTKDDEVAIFPPVTGG